MKMLNLLREWLDTLPDARTFNLKMGDWWDFEQSVTVQYMAMQVVGGQPPREVNTRTAQVAVTLVGARDDSPDTIAAFADSIVEHTRLIPLTCGLTSVIMIGEVIGPIRSEGGRPVLTLTLTLIT